MPSIVPLQPDPTNITVVAQLPAGGLPIPEQGDGNSGGIDDDLTNGNLVVRQRDFRKPRHGRIFNKTWNH